LADRRRGVINSDSHENCSATSDVIRDRNRSAGRELAQRLLDDEKESNEERQRDDAGCPHGLRLMDHRDAPAPRDQVVHAITKTAQEITWMPPYTSTVLSMPPTVLSMPAYMRRRLFGALSLCLVQLATGRPIAPSPARMTLVKADRLLDPRTGNVLAPVAVLIDGGPIKQVGPPSQVQAAVSPGTTLVDLGSATLLPGLIDSHTHLPWLNADLRDCGPAYRLVLSSIHACSS